MASCFPVFWDRFLYPPSDLLYKVNATLHTLVSQDTLSQATGVSPGHPYQEGPPAPTPEPLNRRGSSGAVPATILRVMATRRPSAAVQRAHHCGAPGGDEDWAHKASGRSQLLTMRPTCQRPTASLPISPTKATAHGHWTETWPAAK